MLVQTKQNIIGLFWQLLIFPVGLSLTVNNPPDDKGRLWLSCALEWGEMAKITN